MLGLAPIGASPIAGNGQRFYVAVGSSTAASAGAGQGGSTTAASGAASGSSIVQGLSNLVMIARGIAVGVATALGFADLFPPRRRVFKVPASGVGGMIPWQKPAAAAEFFVIDFTDALAGDVLADATLAPPDGITATGKTVYGTAVKFKLAGGTTGLETAIPCIVNTQGGQRLVAAPLLDIT